MFNDRRNEFRIGRIEKELHISRFYFNKLKWSWKRRFLFNSFYFNLFSNVNPHVAIVGESGSGKSNLCKLILKGLADRNIAFVLLDPHNEYVKLGRNVSAEVYDSSHTGVNPFELDGFSEGERTSELVGMFRRVFGLGQVQSYTLQKCISYMYYITKKKSRTPSVSQLIYCINIFKRHLQKSEKPSRTEISTLESLERRLSLLGGISYRNNIDLSRVISGRSIFALASLHTHEAQTVYIEGLLKKLYSRMLGMEVSKRIKLYIIVDEAEKLMEDSIIGRIIAEGRKYGIGVIAISQRAKALGKELRSNAASFFAFYEREPEELNYIANMIAGGNELDRFAEVKKAVRNLRVGEAVVLASNSKKVRLVRFDSYKVLKEELVPDLSEILTLSKNCASKKELMDILRGQGFEPKQVENEIKKLVDSGALKEYILDSTEYAGEWYITDPLNSAEHDICVNIISRHLTSLGIENRVQNVAYKPDVEAMINGERVAVEYERGLNPMPEIERTLERRKVDFARVVIVTNDLRFERYAHLGGIELLRLSDFLDRNMDLTERHYLIPA